MRREIFYISPLVVQGTAIHRDETPTALALGNFRDDLGKPQDPNITANTKFWQLVEASLNRKSASAPEPGGSESAQSRSEMPDPRSARTPEEFVSKMRQLKAYTGLTLRQISERAGVPSELPRSTLSDALNKKALPKDTVLRHFLRACGLTEEQSAVWEAVRRRIAMDQAS